MDLTLLPGLKTAGVELKALKGEGREGRGWGKVGREFGGEGRIVVMSKDFGVSQKLL